jgi:CDP-diacylglycerol---serine O-phosphatidyltransferase
MIGNRRILRHRSTPRRNVFAPLPTLLTLGNAVCGFAAITFAAMVGPQDFTDQVTFTRSSNQMLFASAGFILLAMVFDALDGSVARLTKQTTDFGVQLDSLCDVVSFGVAPAFLMLKLMHPGHRLMEAIAPMPFQYPPRILWAIAVMFMVCAILRLARFNAETDEGDSHKFFKGLPSPAAAGVIASFPVGLQGLKEVAQETLQIGRVAVSQPFAERFLSPVTILLPLFAILVSLLMISQFRYPHLMNHFLRGGGNRRKILTVLFAALVIFIFREMAFPVFFCYFAFGEPVRVGFTNLWGRIRRRKALTSSSLPSP